MANNKRKVPTQDAGPAQPSWRQPPARRRQAVRRLQSTTAPAVKQASKPAPDPRTAARPGLHLPSAAEVREVARRVSMLAFTIGFVLGMIQLLRLPQLAVSAASTQIGGAQRIPPDQIYIASRIDGRNIFLVRPADIANAIDQIDGIASVQVHVRLPNQVLIDVREHVPLVAWQGITTTIWLTTDGALVPLTGQTPPLTLVDQTGTLPDAESPMAPALLKNLMALHAALPDVAEVVYSRSQGLSFRTPEGWDVWLGDNSPLDSKLALLEVARQEITRLGEQARVIDLRYSNQRAIWW